MWRNGAYPVAGGMIAALRPYRQRAGCPCDNRRMRGLIFAIGFLGGTRLFPFRRLFVRAAMPAALACPELDVLANELAQVADITRAFTPELLEVLGLHGKGAAEDAFLTHVVFKPGGQLAAGNRHHLDGTFRG